MDPNRYTHLEVNVTHLLHNLHYFRSLLPPQCKLLVLVKAFAYGHGSGHFVRILEENGVDYLAVAHPSEGVILRRSGIRLPIMVLSGGEENYPTIIANHLEPSIPVMSAFNRFVEEVRKAGKSHYPIHIKLDTGMHRLGFSPEDLPELMAALPCPEIEVASVFSHLVAASNPQSDAFTHTQIALFESCSRTLMDILPNKPMRHMLNSAGTERFAREAAYDMVRVGIGLYGISALGSDRVLPTAYLKTPVLQVKHVAQGETVGYERAGKVTDGPMTIATIAIGYADGINRHLGKGRAQFAINGHLAPIVGSVCMDMCMLDVTGLDVKAGDMVTVFGDNPTISDLAAILDTIPYEILTSIPHRIPRIYVRS